MKIELYNDKVNINYLNESLSLYSDSQSNPNIDIYLIMNRNTMSKLANEVAKEIDFALTPGPGDGAYSVYRGYPIAACEYLKDGEVEIK